MVTKSYNISETVIVYVYDSGLMDIIDTANYEQVSLDYDEQQSLSNLLNGGLDCES